MTKDFRIIFCFAISLGIYISFGKCESYETDLTENYNLDKFFSENLYGKRFTVIVDVSHVNLNKVKMFWRNYDVSSNSQIDFGIINGSVPDLAISNFNFTSAKKMMQRIQSLEPSENANHPPATHPNLFQILETISMTVPPNRDVVFFTGRPAVGEPSHQILTPKKLNEKHIRVFIVWTGDSVQSVNALRTIAQSSNGSLKFVSRFVRIEDSGKEISNSKPNETSGPEKSVHEKDGLDTFSEAQGGERRLREVSLSAEGDPEEGGRQNLAEIRFPEADPPEEMPDLKMANSIPSGNASSNLEKQVSKAKFFIPVIVEVSSSSNLECLPGDNLKIAFDVTNNMLTHLSLTFSVIDFRNLRVVNIQPRRRILYPMEKVVVEVTVQAPSRDTNYAEGHIKFIASTDDNKRTIREALIYVTDKVNTDTYDPKISYSYKGDCKKHDKPDTCHAAEWSVEATIQDEGSGLKKVLSEPYGLLFLQPLIAGTKSPVTVFYSASCCQLKVEIYAEDGKGNYIRHVLDINNQGLLTGEIAAIVVGVLLLIFIVIAVIVAIVLIRRRNQSKLIIPRYQSSSGS